jgi:hypothetical protein
VPPFCPFFMVYMHIKRKVVDMRQQPREKKEPKNKRCAPNVQIPRTSGNSRQFVIVTMDVGFFLDSSFLLRHTWNVMDK